MTDIYNVVDLTEVYGSAAYGVQNEVHGVVSVWTDYEMAEDVAEELMMYPNKIGYVKYLEQQGDFTIGDVK